MPLGCFLVRRYVRHRGVLPALIATAERFRGSKCVQWTAARRLCARWMIQGGCEALITAQRAAAAWSPGSNLSTRLRRGILLKAATWQNLDANTGQLGSVGCLRSELAAGAPIVTSEWWDGAQMNVMGTSDLGGDCPADAQRDSGRGASRLAGQREGERPGQVRRGRDSSCRSSG